MSEAFILNLSPRSPDYKSGERTECVVAVDLNLIRLPVDLATKWLACARKLKRKTNSNTQACEIHPFYANASLRDSCDIIFLVQFNVEFPRQAMVFPIDLIL